MIHNNLGLFNIKKLIQETHLEITYLPPGCRRATQKGGTRQQKSNTKENVCPVIEEIHKNQAIKIK